MKAWPFLVLFLCRPASADDPINRWAAHFDDADIQRAILDRVSPTPVLDDGVPILEVQERTFAFPATNGWVQLSGAHLLEKIGPAASDVGLVVTCLYRHDLKGEPISAATYLILPDHKTAITNGYATREWASAVDFPGLHRHFVGLSRQNRTSDGRVYGTAMLEDVGGGGAHVVWESDTGFQHLVWGIADIDGDGVEEIILKTLPAKPAHALDLYDSFHLFDSNSSGDTVQYKAYRWDGNQFRRSDQTLDTVLKALPAGVWLHEVPLSEE